MVAKTALIPPSDGTINILFITVLTAVVTLHILTLILGSRKLSPTVPTAPVLPTPVHQPLPRPRPTTPDPPTQDYQKRLEKLDETLKMLEEKIKSQPAKNTEPAKTPASSVEKTQEVEHPTTADADEGETLAPESLDDIIRLARELRDELNTLMKSHRQNAAI
ncbi:MAG: hypothetical protein QXE96_04110 [Candidatus Caldarchaeum sp.]